MYIWYVRVKDMCACLTLSSEQVEHSQLQQAKNCTEDAKSSLLEPTSKHQSTCFLAVVV
jgi:hypothetical protein